MKYPANIRHRLGSNSPNNSPEMMSCHQVDRMALMRGKLIGGKIALTAATSHRISSTTMNPTPSARVFQEIASFPARLAGGETTAGGGAGIVGTGARPPPRIRP